MTEWPYVLVAGLTEPVADAKRYSFDSLTRFFGPENCVHVVHHDDMCKLTKQVSGKAAVLVGLTSRPQRELIDQWTKKLGAGRGKVALGHKLWHEPINNTFLARSVAPNQHRIALSHRDQVMWDMAVSDNYRKRTPSHHPLEVSRYYSRLGVDVAEVAAVSGLDSRTTGYSAVVNIDGTSFDPRSLVSIGRHRRFSGLLVPQDVAA